MEVFGSLLKFEISSWFLEACKDGTVSLLLIILVSRAFSPFNLLAIRELEILCHIDVHRDLSRFVSLL